MINIAVALQATGGGLLPTNAFSGYFFKNLLFVLSFIDEQGCSVFIGVEDMGARGARAPPPQKNREKYFSGNYCVKFGHFSGKNSVKFRKFVNFSGKYHKNKGILIIFRARIM